MRTLSTARPATAIRTQNLPVYVLAVAAVYGATRLLSAVLLGSLSRQAPTIQNTLLWLLAGVLITVALVPLLRRSPWDRKGSILAAWAVLALPASIGLGIEGYLFTPTEPIVAIASTSMKVFASLLVAAAAVYLLPDSARIADGSAVPPARRFGPLGWAWRLVVASLSYFAFYFLFGGINALLYTRAFYETNPTLQLPPVGTVVQAQLIRGPLMVLGVVAFAVALHYSRRRVAFWLGGLLFVVAGLAPYLEVTFFTMPLGFNLATLTEVLLQNGLTGVVIACLFGRKPVPVGSRPLSLGRKAILLVGRGSLAVVLFVVCVVVAAQLVPSGATAVSHSTTAPNPVQALTALVAWGVFCTVALAYPVIRSRWTGWRLVAGLFVAFAGVTPVLLQVESFVFLVFLVPIIPAEVLQRIILSGFVTALLFTPLVVLAFGKMRGPSDVSPVQRPDHWSLGEWVSKLLLISVIYAAIYFSFGDLILLPLAGPAFREYYGDLQLPFWFPLFQLARGAVWALIMLPVIRMMKGRWWEAGLAVAMLSSFLTAAPLLNQNEYMPDQMRLAHFFELLSSNFVFGWAIFWLFHRHHDSPRDLIG